MTPATPATRSHLACVLVAAVVLAATPVATAGPVEGTLSAQAATFASASLTTPATTLLHLRHDADAVPDTRALDGDFQVNTLDIEWYHEEQLVWRAQGTSGEQPDPAAQDPSSPAKTYNFGAGTLAMAPSQPGYLASSHFPAGATVDTTVAPAQVGSLGRAQASRAGIAEAEAGGAAPTDEPDGQIFTSFRSDGTQVLATVDAASTTVSIRGDGIVEIVGIDLAFTDSAGSVTHIHTGTTLTPVQVGPNGDGLYRLTTDFARLRVQGLDGGIELAGPEAVLQMAAGAATASTSGDVRLASAQGRLVGEDGTESTLATQDLKLEGRNSLALAPRGAGVMGVGLTGLDAQGNPIPAGVRNEGLPGGWPVAVVGVFVALAALAFAVMAILVRMRRSPSQADVESALVKGQFERAASLAGRILKTKPGLEDAVISRAIALAKQGRPERVVAELTAHLGNKDPSDGVVHYVLGLAYLDLGRRDQAQRALQEAVRRTPALLPEATSRMGQPLQPSTPERMEAHGYA